MAALPTHPVGRIHPDAHPPAPIARVSTLLFPPRSPRPTLPSLALSKARQTVRVGHRRSTPSPCRSRRLVPFADRVFNTPTGRVEFYVERLLPYRQALPVYVPPIEANSDGELIKRYPLVCLTEHSRYRVHSTFGNAPWLRELDQGPLAVLHPSAAQARGIHNDDVVRLYNDRGFVVLRARVVQSVPPGTVYLTQGWQSSDFQAGHAQTLTHGQGNPSNALGVNSSFSDVLVEVVKEDRCGDEG